MKKVTIDVLKESAKKLLFDMSEEEYQTLFEEFSIITKQMELISTIENVDNVEPMTFPFECSVDYLREDVASECLSQEDALKNAKDVVDGQIRLPKVVG
ncbi:MAG: Asp-tRNA(Asn)/Glu-tRNA(Gln) amidotransferase subunit GatC [Bacilli bacterium]